MGLRRPKRQFLLKKYINQFKIPFDIRLKELPMMWCIHWWHLWYSDHWSVVIPTGIHKVFVPLPLSPPHLQSPWDVPRYHGLERASLSPLSHPRKNSLTTRPDAEVLDFNFHFVCEPCSVECTRGPCSHKEGARAATNGVCAVTECPYSLIWGSLQPRREPV